MNRTRGLVTGIGSLPFIDVNEALDLIFKYCPQIPFWPQLPKRDIREGMIAQFSEKIPCLEFSGDGVFFNPGQREEKLEEFYGRIIALDFDYFKVSRDYALGLYEFSRRLERTGLENIEFIKCHITGPFTFAASINGIEGKPLLHDEVFMQVILKAITMKAIWQVNFFKKFGKKIIIFFDEPYLSGFGSAYTPVNREDVVKALSELTQAVKSDQVLTGVHCCGNTDWSMFTDTEGLDIINFDFSFLERLALYSRNLESFLGRGGLLCWGVVPTSGLDGRQNSEYFLSKIKEGLEMLVKKGLNQGQLLDSMVLSPACGLGMSSPEQAEKIFSALSQISSKIKYLTK